MSAPASLAPARSKRGNIPSAAVLNNLDSALPSQQEAARAYIQAEKDRAAEVTAAQRLSSPHVPSMGATSPPSSRASSPEPALPKSKRAYVEDFDETEDGWNAREDARINPNPKAKKSRQSKAAPDPVDANGIPLDVNVQTISDDEPTKKNASADVDQFFSAPFDSPDKHGKMKAHRKCKGCSCGKAYVRDASTLRRHAESKFAGKYRKWAKDSNFISMLPSDVEDRKIKAKITQRSLDEHLVHEKLSERVLSYTDQRFR
ncbi:hypothetical protein FIBSPDRAFT_944523, partial [Athelia psychrophila]